MLVQVRQTMDDGRWTTAMVMGVSVLHHPSSIVYRLSSIVPAPSSPVQMDVLDGVESLVGNILLRQEEGLGGDPRFVRLDCIHEYALENLEEVDPSNGGE